jgi:uncharacterized protein (DUF983 family)
MRWLRTFVRAALLGRCPHCGQGSMFRGWYSMHDRCAVCGTRFETADGAWIGAVAVGYGFGALFGVAAALAEVAWHPIGDAGFDPAWTIAIASLPVTIIMYRPAKGIWFGLLYLFGFMETPVSAS